MDSHADPGDPLLRFARIYSYSQYTLLVFTVFFVVSCRERKKEVAVKKPVTDSSLLHQPDKHRADSIAAVSANKKKIYLTFDDGPNKGTPNVYRVIQEEKVPASFFIVGKHVFDKPEQTREWELLKTDSTIDRCNHSYTHAAGHYSRYYRHPREVVEDIEHNRQVLGLTNKIVRMPGRNAWRTDSFSHTDVKESRAAIDSVRASGFDILGWDLEWQFDHKTLAPDADTALLLRRIYNLLDAGGTRTRGHLVLLAHDQSFQKEEYVQLLQYIIRQLKNNPDYELRTARYYPGINN